MEEEQVETQSPQTSTTENASENLSVGSYSNFSFTYQKQNNKVGVTFSPMLPRNDEIVIGAMKAVVKTVFGEEIAASSQPHLVDRGGVNIIVLSGDGTDYLFLLIKEDTGEIHSFSVWTE